MRQLGRAWPHDTRFRDEARDHQHGLEDGGGFRRPEQAGLVPTPAAGAGPVEHDLRVRLPAGAVADEDQAPAVGHGAAPQRAVLPQFEGFLRAPGIVPQRSLPGGPPRPVDTEEDPDPTAAEMQAGSVHGDGLQVHGYGTARRARDESPVPQPGEP
ncbi:hypothetical protein UG55_102420 [Frankia sp. EI5c]|nr:hypothetical protein UG55_102420 [Frankia sp. EI5c]